MSHIDLNKYSASEESRTGRPKYDCIKLMIGSLSRVFFTFSNGAVLTYSKQFLAAHESDIAIHKAAKKHFDEQGLKKLPGIRA